MSKSFIKSNAYSSFLKILICFLLKSMILSSFNWYKSIFRVGLEVPIRQAIYIFECKDGLLTHLQILCNRDHNLYITHLRILVTLF